MRRHALLMAAAVMAGCAVEPPPRLPPPNRFYYPTGIAHMDVPGSTEGALYVASSNFDKCYTYGQVSALSLADVAELPRLKAHGEYTPAPPEVKAVTALPVTERERRIIQSFAGEMAVWPLGSGGARLFIPARAEGSPLHVVEAGDPKGTTLTCGGDRDSENCFPRAISLEVAPEGGRNGLPAAPSPIGVAVGRTAYGQNKLLVTHLEPAIPLNNTSETVVGQTYVVETTPDEATPPLTPESFIQFGDSLTQSVVVGRRYAYVTSRQTGIREYVVRLVDLHPEKRYVTTENGRQVRVLGTGVGVSFQVTDARGLALDPQERRLYVAIRGTADSDLLLVADIVEPESDFPRLRVVRAVPLAPGVEQVRVIPRANGNVVVVTSTGDQSRLATEGAVSVYDDGLGQVVAEVANLGSMPYGLAIDTRETGGAVTQARIFVSLFGEGRVAVLDMPDVMQPEDTWLVAYLGTKQIEANNSGRQSAACGVGE